MPSFTQTFGGTTIYPADVSYRAVTLSANVTLAWPTELATDTNVVAEIMDVTPSAASLAITMPPANQVSVGQTTLFFNVGADTFTIKDNGGNTITTVASGLSYQIYLIDNSTVNGTWRTTQFGAGTSTATAGSLVGYGIKAIGTSLNQSSPVTDVAVDYTFGSPDRAGTFIWTGGAGTLSLPDSSTLGDDWFVQVRNGGSGSIAVTPATGGQLINGASTLDFNPGDSAIIVTDGSNYFTVGYGQSPVFAFDFVSIDLTAQVSPYTLSGANLNRIAYSFSGTLTGNMDVVVPTTVQQYWISNDTDVASAPYTITVKTASGTGVATARNNRAIMYCDGVNVVDADTSSVSLPVAINQGGTGAVTASAARTNLGGTSVGIAVFTAATAADARTGMSAAASGANSDITSLSALSTPLSVAQGGTGAATLTGYVKGAGTSAMTASTTIPATDLTGTIPITQGGTGQATSRAAYASISVGTNTNDNAAAGNVGEYVESILLVGAGVGLTSGAPADVVPTIALTAGDWDVWAELCFTASGGAAQSLIQGWLSSTSATLPTLPNGGGMAQLQAAFTANGTNTLTIPVKRFSLSGTTNIYCSAQDTHSAGTVLAFGFMGARRVR